MQFSEDTIRVMDFLEQYSETGLRKREDLSILIEIAAAKNDYESVNDLAFTGKAVYNLFQTIKSSKSGDRNIQPVLNEFEKSLVDLRKVMYKLVGDSEEILAKFDLDYLHCSNGAILNVIDISHDLSAFKNMQADARENK